MFALSFFTPLFCQCTFNAFSRRVTMAEANLGSDDAAVQYCQPCGNVVATAFCQICKEYFCSPCSNFHQKQSISKDHALLKGKNMPSLSPTTARRSRPMAPMADVGSFQSCPQHPNEELKLYCEKHDSLCCVACSTAQHKQCETIYIPDVCKNYKSSPEYRALVDDVDETAAVNEIYLDDIDNEKKEVEQLMRDEVAMLEKYRHDIKERVDKRINELSAEIKQIRTKDIVMLEKREAASKKFRDDLSTSKAKLKASDQSPNELYTVAQLVKRDVAKLKPVLVDIGAHIRHQRYNVKKIAQFETHLKDKTGIATIQLVDGKKSM